MSAAERAGATVERIDRSAEALDRALRTATNRAARVLLAEPAYLPSALFAPFRAAPNVVTHPAEADLTSAQVGVTDAFAGVARTGSICVAVSASLGGAVSLFPRTHVAVLATETIFARPRDIFTNERVAGNGAGQDFVFITGPSATADMGPLVRGVHGPEKVHIVILE